MDMITTDQADEIFHLSDVELRTYSGRAMYGEQCAAIVGGVGDLMRFTAALAVVLEEDGEDAVDTLARRVRQDSMGLDQVYYFPGTTLEQDGDA